MRFLLCSLLLLGALHSSASAIPTTTIMHRINLTSANDNLAFANDGTEAFYYFRPGSNPLLWFIYLEGGGACWNNASCTMRWQQDRLLMSAAARSAVTPAEGLLSSDPSVNPFAEANAIYVPYLTSDAYMGNSSSVESGTRWQFRGRPVFQTILQQLLDGFYHDELHVGFAKSFYKIPAGARVLLSGGSAGGIGTLLNANFAMDLVSSSCPSCEFRIAPDSGFFSGNLATPFANESACVAGSMMGCSYNDTIAMGAAMWNILPQIDPWCASEQHKLGASILRCASGSIVASFLKMPVFFMENLFDAVELLMDGCVHFECETKTNGRNFVQNLTLLKKNSLLKHPGFSPSCYGHGIAGGNLSRSVIIRNVSLYEAMTGWYFHNATTTYLDECDKPMCRGGCPKFPFFSGNESSSRW